MRKSLSLCGRRALNCHLRIWNYLFICRLQLLKSHVLVHKYIAIFIISLFDNLSIYSFPFGTMNFCYNQGHLCHFTSHLTLLLAQTDSNAIYEKKNSIQCQIRKFKFSNALEGRLICFSAKQIILCQINNYLYYTASGNKDKKQNQSVIICVQYRRSGSKHDISVP
jgi:hypothetical protein